MPEKHRKLSAFEEELFDTIKRVNQYKIGCETNIISILYKKPDLIYETNLTLDELRV